MKPKEIQKVASYILSLQGSNPKDAKEAEGEIWAEETASKPADSTAVKK